MVTIPHKRKRICSECEGKGGKNAVQCKTCKGRGVVEKIVQLGPGFLSSSRGPCQECKGKGNIYSEQDKCQKCKGECITEEEKQLEVAIEVGIPDEHIIPFPGDGDEYVSI